MSASPGGFLDLQTPNLHFNKIPWRILCIVTFQVFFSVSVPSSAPWYNYNSVLYLRICLPSVSPAKWVSLVAQTVKYPPEMQETHVQSLGWEDPLEKGMATHSSILAWRIPWTEEPGGLQSMGS